MKRHLTSWSNISKALPGWTENSIKNYFYSSIRRIQSSKIIERLKNILESQIENPSKEDLKSMCEGCLRINN